MDRNTMMCSNDLSSILIIHETQKLLENMESNRKCSEIDVSIERKILSVAKNYGNGIFEKCDYIRPNEAYECIRYIVEYSRKSSITDYIYEIENEINKIALGECYNKYILEEYTKCIIKFIETKSAKESEFKRCGREYELFDF